MEIHVVQSGETMEGIAETYNSSYEELLQYNQLPNPDNLVVGQCVLIPSASAPLGEMIVNGYLYPHIDEEVYRQALPSLTNVTIFGYGFDAEGNLIETPDEEVIAIAKSYGVQPIMLLAAMDEQGQFSLENGRIVFNNTLLQEKLIAGILVVMQQKGYVGLDIDMEFIPADLKEAYINFIENVTRQLNQYGYFVNVDLAPKVSATQQGLLYESHDYARIGQIVDRVLLMTYEWGYTYGPPMAVAPLPSVKRVLDYGVTEIAREKIFMGIPNYGYDWPLPYERGVTAARTIGNEEAIMLAVNYRTEILFDENAMSPYFYYTDEQGIQHVVWFEDARSIQAKIQLGFSYPLRGLGYWNIMRPFPQNWRVVDALCEVEKM